MYTSCVLRQVALGQAQDSEPVTSQAAEHVNIGIMILSVLRSEVGRRDSYQQAQRRRPTSRQRMRGGAEQERIEAGRRATRKVYATTCVGAFVHDNESPSRAREFLRAGLLGIVHGRGFGFGFGFPGFGLFFGFGHKYAAVSGKNAQFCFTRCCACATASKARNRPRASLSGFRSKCILSIVLLPGRHGSGSIERNRPTCRDSILLGFAILIPKSVEA
jgi:hypothetical protein